MTWSIVARHGSGAFGVAVASGFFAVGDKRGKRSITDRAVIESEIERFHANRKRDASAGR